MSERSIVHPGPPHAARRVLVRGRAEATRWMLPAGAVLLDALAARMAASGAGAAIVHLDGMAIAAGDYVMPARPTDHAHAAWYSPARAIGVARLEHATAVVGKKEGRWFVHCHALWPGSGETRMGHLLNDTVRIGAAAAVRAWLFHGGRFVARPDPETGFPLFIPEGGGAAGRSALLTVRPHESLRAALTAAAAEAELLNGVVVGLGSLIGARFAGAPPMTDPISEIVLLPGARIKGGRCRALPVAAVDLGGRVHRGELLDAPICVTGEFLLAGN